jgi:hypothetical protein
MLSPNADLLSSHRDTRLKVLRQETMDHHHQEARGDTAELMAARLLKEVLVFELPLNNYRATSSS